MLQSDLGILRLTMALTFGSSQASKPSLQSRDKIDDKRLHDRGKKSWPLQQRILQNSPVARSSGHLFCIRNPIEFFTTSGPRFVLIDFHQRDSLIRKSTVLLKHDFSDVVHVESYQIRNKCDNWCSNPERAGAVDGVVGAPNRLAMTGQY